MTDPAHEVMADVWKWKQDVEDETRGLSPAEAIEYYRQKADDLEKRFGVKLTRRTPADASRRRRPWLPHTDSM